jgi:hypothetical protein
LEASRAKCQALRLHWEEAYEAWQDAVAALKKLGGVPPVDAQTEQSDALAIARQILEEEPPSKQELLVRDEDVLAPTTAATADQLDAVLGEADWQHVSTIQARQRGNRARKDLLEQQSAATKIQSVQRGKRTRRQQQQRGAEAEAEAEPEGADRSDSTAGGSENRAPRQVQQLNARSTFETDGSGRVSQNSKTVFLSHVCIKTKILPRQARDKHSENSNKRTVLPQVWGNTDRERMILHLTHK